VQAEIGIVYNPIMEELFTARAGQGAFCNGTKLQVTKVEGILNIILNFTEPFKSHSHSYCYCMCKLMTNHM